MKKNIFRWPVLMLICTFFFVLGVSLSSDQSTITRDVVLAAEKLIGIHLTDSKADSMISGLNDQLKYYQNMRKIIISNDIMPAFQFNPLPKGFKIDKTQKPVIYSKITNVSFPPNIDNVAFYSLGQLAELIKTKKITSLQLTKMYLERLKKFGQKLECYTSITEELAIEQAEKADREIASGNYKGPLHGIPYGIKDLFSTKKYKTTWGSVPFKNQVIDKDATVVKRLEKAGAVLIAKFTLGELAMGDVWYGGKTRNPWDITKGSSGSSAGSAAATSAGLVAFSIGTETYGSIVSPSTVCGVTGLRPTFGRVSRSGAMALSWTMDKVGPICRYAEDCAMVFNAIYGTDTDDPTTIDAAFNYDSSVKLSDLKIAYLKSDFESEKDSIEKSMDYATLKKLQELGAKLVPIALPKFPINEMIIILTSEAATAFNELTLNGKVDEMVMQTKDDWPNIFRTSCFVPAVEYIKANRLRNLLIQEMEKIMKDVDVYISPTFNSDNLLLTNLTGHPCVVLPNGFVENNTPKSITIIGKLFGEANLLSVAKAYQDATNFHLKHPSLN